MQYCVRKRNFQDPIIRDSKCESIDQYVSEDIVRRFLLRAGFREYTDQIIAMIRSFLCAFLKKVTPTILILSSHFKCTSIRLAEVMRALEFHQIRLYGFDDVCVIEWPLHKETMHLTELIELNTVLNTQCSEPEKEIGPRTYYNRPDFVGNLNSWPEEEEEDDEESEWSWTNDTSSEDSDADIESADEEISHISDESISCLDLKDRLLRSVEAAQLRCDGELAIQPPQSSAGDEDIPIGQGYSSDYDDINRSQIVSDFEAHFQEESSRWNSVENLKKMDNECAERIIKAEIQRVDGNQYLMSRQSFADLFRIILCQHRTISSAALCALHNATEGYLHRCLTEGSLGEQIKSILLTEEVKHSSKIVSVLQNQLDERNAKVMEQENVIAEMKCKQEELQKRIVQLQNLLYGKDGGKENENPNADCRLDGSSLGKRIETCDLKKTNEIFRHTKKLRLGTL